MSDDFDLNITLPAQDQKFIAQAWHKLIHLTKPQGSLGILEDIAAFMCGWQRSLTPRAEKAYTLIFAGNHGVVGQGVSAYPASVTEQMVVNFNAGGAAINQLCKAIPSQLSVIPIDLAHPTQDFTQQPAMSLRECYSAFQIGIDAVPHDADILVLGEMGIGNTTSAAAIAQFFCKGTVNEFVGRGTGIDDQIWCKKCEVVSNALKLHTNTITNSFELLACLGGRELAAMAGAIWQARKLRIPVILDGYVVTSAASALTLSNVNALEHCLSGHCSVEPGHIKLLEHLGMKPILSLNMRLGEGSGAQLALGIVRAAISTFNGMASFDTAGVSQKI